MLLRFKISVVAFVLFFGINTICTSQSSTFFVGGAHATSLAHTGSVFEGISAIYGNPAGLMTIVDYAVDVSYDRRYSLSQLATVSVAGAKRVGEGAFGVSVSRFGYTAYSESKIGLTYARKLFSKLSIGGSFDYLNYNVANYGSTNRFTFELGIQSQINKRLMLGAYVFSPGSISLTDDQIIPSRYFMGLKYNASNKANLFVEISKTINRDPDFKFSVDYKIIESFSLRAGANITNSSIHFGPAYRFTNGLQILGAYSYDNRLGHTTAISLSYWK